MSKESVTFTYEEINAIYDLIDELSGGNASNAFSWDGKDSLEDENTSAMCKIFKTLGRSIPKNLESSFEEANKSCYSQDVKKCLVIEEGQLIHKGVFRTNEELEAFTEGVWVGDSFTQGHSHVVVAKDNLGEYGKAIDNLIKKHLGD